MYRWLLLVALCGCFPGLALLDEPCAAPEASAGEAADLILHHAKVVMVDDTFSIAQALAVRGDRLVAVGDNQTVMRLRGPKTRVIDAGGRMVLPGLYDSHVHPVMAATSELVEPIPELGSLPEVFAWIRQKAAATPEGHWIVLHFAFPTRLKEARFPTRAELDQAAPRHPVLYHAGPAGVVNSMGLKVSGVTRDTPNPPAGVIVHDPATGEPTGMLRNAYGVLKGVPPVSRASEAAKRAAVQKLFHLYNTRGLTSIADRNADRAALDLYRSLRDHKELTVRINVARGLNPLGSREEVIRRLDDLPGKDHLGGPTGVGGVWVRIGPIKFFLDGGMLNGTAYMRRPWPKGATYQVVEDDYRGLLFLTPEQVKTVVVEAARRGWQVTAHTAGEGAMDVLLDAYEFANRQVPIKDKRFCITHANFPSPRNLERCRELGVCADVQPAWLYKDGTTLARVLGPERIRWFQPYKSWLKYTTIGGGSDHMIKLDPLKSTNPWDPWLGMEVAITRRTEGGLVLTPEERLTRQQAIRLYTINNAYLNREEKDKGSLEVGKLADFIVIDRDLLTCPADTIRQTRVLYTMVGGQIVYRAPEAGPRRPAQASALPVPPKRAFRPLPKEWIAEVDYLDYRGAGDPPNAGVVIQPKDRDPAVKDYYKEVSSYAKKGDAKPRRILRYHPSGYLAEEIDNLGDEQFSRSFYAGGNVSCYLHWRNSRWLNGYSISPDGKTKHRLVDGKGQVAEYGSKPGNRVQRWYHDGDNFLEKRYVNGACTMIRLNVGSDWLIAEKSGLERLVLHARNEFWHKAPGMAPQVQKGNELPRVNDRDSPKAAAERQKLYARRRADFVRRYDDLLRRYGETWEQLDIEFLRTGARWPE